MKKIDVIEMREITAGDNDLADFILNYDDFLSFGECLTLTLKNFGVFFVSFYDNNSLKCKLVDGFGFQPWNATEGTYSFYVSIKEHLNAVYSFFHKSN